MKIIDLKIYFQYWYWDQNNSSYWLSGGNKSRLIFWAGPRLLVSNTGLTGGIHG